MNKSEIVEIGILAFVFGCGFWVSAEVMDFVFGIASEILDMI